MPKIHLLYFKNVLDIAFIHFFNDHNDSFTKVGDKYVMSKSMSVGMIRKKMTKYVIDIISEIVEEFDMTSPNFYFMIGSCLPKNNILLKYRDSKYFPEKLERLINSEYQIKYYLKEKDIVIDTIKFNDIVMDIFNDLFTNRSSVVRKFKEKSRNLFFIQHRNLDCYSMFRIIKEIFGRNNCINVFKDRLQDLHSPINAINDMICKYINNKKEILKTEEFRNVKSEIERYMRECIDSSFN